MDEREREKIFKLKIIIEIDYSRETRVFRGVSCGYVSALNLTSVFKLLLILLLK